MGCTSEMNFVGPCDSQSESRKRLGPRLARIGSLHYQPYGRSLRRAAGGRRVLAGNLLDPAMLPEYRELLEKYWDACSELFNKGCANVRFCAIMLSER